MKKMSRLMAILCVGIGACGLSGSPAAPPAEPRFPARSCRVSKNTSFMLTADVPVVIAPDAPKTVRFAAEELRDFLSAMFGAKVRIVTAPPPQGAAVVVGLNRWSKAAGLDESKLTRDAFFIKTSGGKLYLAGRDDKAADLRKAISRGGIWAQMTEHASTFAVYEFLEKFAGVRMYFPGELGTIIPPRSRLAVPEIEMFERPDFSQRRYSHAGDGVYFEGKERGKKLHPQKTLNMYRLRFETRYLPCCHGLNKFQYLKRFTESHPEYFCLMGNGARSIDPTLQHPGHLCYSSGIREEIYQDVKSFLRGEAATVRGLKSWGKNCTTEFGGVVDIMSQDGFNGCRCPKCQAGYDQSQPNFATEFIWGFTAEIANRLKKEGVRGMVTQMAYRPYRSIPKIAIPDNVRVMVAERGPWNLAMPESDRRDMEEIVAWTRKLNRRVWIWTYPHKHAKLNIPGVPHYAPRAMGAYYQKVAPWIFGAYAESESDRFMYSFLNLYVFSKVCWNNSTDVKALLDEHYRLMYGKAAPQMRAVFEEIEDIWMQKICGRTVDTILGPTGAPPSDYEIWHKIYTPQRIARLGKTFDAAAELVGVKTPEGRRVQLMKREFYEPMRAASEKFTSTGAAIAGLRFYAGSAPGQGAYLLPYYGRRAIPRDLPKVATRVQFWRTRDELCFKFHCEEPHMNQLIEPKRERDEGRIWNDNEIEIFLNPSGDGVNYYQIMINSGGSLTDVKGKVIGGDSHVLDAKWNSNAKIAIDKRSDAWSVTVKIPVSGFDRVIDCFPANFARSRALRGVKAYHAAYTATPFIAASGFHNLSRWGKICFGEGKNLVKDAEFTCGERFVPAKKNTLFGQASGKRFIASWFGKATLEKNIVLTAPGAAKLTGDGKMPLYSTQYLPTLKPNTKYRISFYAKTDNVVQTSLKGGGATFIFFDSQNHFLPPRNLITGTTDWQYYSYEITTAPETNGKKKNRPVRSYIRVGVYSAAGTAYFDNIRIEEIKR